MKRVRPVRAIDRAAAVDERRHAAHLFRRPHQRGRVLRRPLSIEAGRSVRRVDAQVDEPGALQRERPVVLREAFGEPQLARHVRAIEIERLERPSAGCARRSSSERTRARRCRADRVARAGDRAGGGHHRAVAVLHAVAAGVRQVVGEKRVVARLVLRDTRRRSRLPARTIFSTSFTKPSSSASVPVWCSAKRNVRAVRP